MWGPAVWHCSFSAPAITGAVGNTENKYIVNVKRILTSGWRQSIVATLKANAAGIRFDFYALAQRTGEKQLFIINSSVFRLYVPQLPVFLCGSRPRKNGF
jgi:hypothetical protein